MLTLNDAKSILERKYPEYIIDSGLETEEEWIFSMADRETRMELDISPLSVSKSSGDVKVFFPPRDASRITNAMEIPKEYL